MNTKALKRWLPLIIIVLITGAAWACGLMDVISLETIKSQRGRLLDTVSAHPVISLVGFIALYTVACALSLPIATVLTLVGGFLFGRWLGTAAAVIGATAGATIVFLIARSALGAALREKAGPLYHKIAANMENNAVGYMLFMRLVPLFPFFVVNIIPALLNVRLVPFMLITLIGIIPGSFVYANLGTELGTINSLGDVVKPQTLIAFTLLGLLALIPTIYKQLKNRTTVLAIALALILTSSQVAFAGEAYRRFLALYDGLLQSHILAGDKQGIAYNGVDYEGWAADPRHKEALRHLLAENPAAHSEDDEKKAFWINTYNFLTIELIVRTGERESIKNLGGILATPWTRHAWTLAGRNYTLDHIEHRILRPMRDPRIHFAINCASVSCPDLSTEAYRAETLDGQLDAQVKRTLANPGKGLRIARGTVYASKIFDWFAEDFNGGDVRGWLRTHAHVSTPVSLRYMNYDWSLNKVDNK